MPTDFSNFTGINQSNANDGVEEPVVDFSNATGLQIPDDLKINPTPIKPTKTNLADIELMSAHQKPVTDKLIPDVPMPAHQPTLPPKSLPDYDVSKLPGDKSKRSWFSENAIDPVFFTGTVSPEMKTEMSSRGFGPQPEGGWSDTMEPLDITGKPYMDPKREHEELAIKNIKDSFVDTFTRVYKAAQRPWELGKGAAELVLSIPGFAMGMATAVPYALNQVMRKIAGMEDASLKDIYLEASKIGQKASEFIQPSIEMFRSVAGQPTPESTLIGDMLMYIPMAGMNIAWQIADHKLLQNSPNIQGAILIGAEIFTMGLTGAMMSRGIKPSQIKRWPVDQVKPHPIDEIINISKSAEDLVKKKDELDKMPDSDLKAAAEAALNAEREALDLRAKEIMNSIKDSAIHEDLMRKAEEIEMARVYPVKDTGLGLEPPTVAEKNKVLKTEIKPEDVTHTYTSKKGNEYRKVGDKWYDKNGDEVTNTFRIKAFEKGKSEIGAEEPSKIDATPAEPVVELPVVSVDTLPKGITPINRTSKLYHKSSKLESLENGFEQRPLGISFSKKKEHTYSSPTIKDKEGTKGDVVVEFTGKGLNYKIKKHRNFIESLFEEAAAKEAPQYDIYVLDKLRSMGIDYIDNFNGIGKAANEVHVINAKAVKIVDKLAEQSPNKPTEVLPSEPPKAEPPAADSSQSRPPRRKEIEPKPVEPPKKQPRKKITKTDERLGEVNEQLSAENSPLNQTFEEAAALSKEFEGREKALKDPETFTAKLINDVNKWRHGDDSVDIEQTRSILSRLSSTTERAREYFDSPANHLGWSELVQQAADWAAKVERVKPTTPTGSGVNLYSGLPASKAVEFLKNYGRNLKDRWIKSVNNKEPQLIRDILALHTDGNIDADITYSKGAMWKKVGVEPRLKFDKRIQADGVTEYDLMKGIPVEDSSLKSVMFDPPFLVHRPTKSKGIIADRFTKLDTIDDLWALHKRGIDESFRILQPGGKLIVKVQDIVDSNTGQFRASSSEVYNFAIQSGFKPVDRFIYENKNPMPMPPNIKKQDHARRTHSDYWVFEKPKRSYTHPMESGVGLKNNPTDNVLNSGIPVKEVTDRFLRLFDRYFKGGKSIYRNRKMWEDTGWWIGKDNFVRFEVPLTKGDINPHYFKQDGRYSTVMLKDIISNDTKTSQIPGFDHIKVSFEPIGTTNGSFNYRENTIRVNSLKPIEKQITTIVHELQHKINYDKKISDGSNALLEIRKYSDQFLKDLYPYAATHLKQSILDMINRKDRTGATRIAQLIDGPDVETHFTDKYAVNAIYNKHMEKAFRDYKLNLGEMEARLFQKRFEMTEAQRLKEAPWETLDKMLEGEGFPKWEGQRLYSGVPIGKLTDPVIEKIVSMFTKFGESPYRNIEMWQKLGIWIGRDDIARIDIPLTKDKINLSKLKSIDGGLIEDYIADKDIFNRLKISEGKVVKEPLAEHLMGSFNPDTGNISMNSNISDVDKLIKNLRHELQHKIQEDYDVPGKGANYQAIYNNRIKDFARELKQYIVDNNVLNTLDEIINGKVTTKPIAIGEFLSDNAHDPTVVRDPYRAIELYNEFKDNIRVEYLTDPGEMEARLFELRDKLTDLDHNYRKTPPWVHLGQMLVSEGLDPKFGTTLYSGIPVGPIVGKVKEMVEKFVPAGISPYRHKTLWKKTGLWIGRDGIVRVEVPLSNSKLNTKRFFEYRDGKVRDFIKDEDTARRHSSVLDIPVKFNKDADGGSYYDTDTKIIHLDSSISSKLDMLSSFRHEVMHAIQDYYGISSGADPAQFIERILFTKYLDEVRNPDTVDIAYQKARRDAEIEYRLNPGEMEARLFAERDLLTEKQRREIPPWETLEQILEYDGFPYGPEESNRLYSGIPIKESLRKLFKNNKRVPGKLSDRIDLSNATEQQKAAIAAGDKFAEAFNQSIEAKKFDFKRFLDRAKFHTYRAVHEQKEMLRKRLREEGREGYNTIIRMDAERGADGHAQRMVDEMLKQAYKDVPSELDVLVDAVNMVERLTDIYKYKTKKQFRPPPGMNPEQTAVFKTLIDKYFNASPEELATAKKASDVMFAHMKSWVDEMREVGLISEEEAANLKAHNYQKMRSISVEDLYDRKYKTKVSGRVLKQTDSGIDSLGTDSIRLVETDSKILYNETAKRIFRRIDNQKTKLAWRDLYEKNPDNGMVIIPSVDKALGREKRKIPKGWSSDMIYEDGKPKTMFFHPDVATQLYSGGGHMSYPLSRLLSLMLGRDLTRFLTVGGSALWGLTRGVTMDLLHTYFAAQKWNPEKGRFEAPYTHFGPKFIGELGHDMGSVARDVLHNGYKTGQYLKNGGSMSFLAQREAVFTGRGIKQRKTYDKIMDGLSYVNKQLEMWNRVAVTERVLRNEAKKRGITLDDAWKDNDLVAEAVHTAVNRLPYGEGGWFVREADKIFGPFIQAGYNAVRSFLRGWKDRQVDYMARVANLAVPTVGLTIAMILNNEETYMEIPEDQHARNACFIMFPEASKFIDRDGNERSLFFKVPLDPGASLYYNTFRLATLKALYEYGVIENEPGYGVMKNVATAMSPTDLPMAPGMQVGISYLTNTDMWRGTKITQDELPFPYSSHEGKYDPKVSQLAKDTFGSIGMSPKRGEVAFRNLGFQSNEFTWALGQTYEAAFNDVPVELRKDVWQVSLARIPGIKNFIGVTVPRSYMSGPSAKIKDDQLIEDMDRIGRFRALVIASEWYQVDDKGEIQEMIIKNKDKPEVVDELKRMQKFARKTANLPNRAYWLSRFHTKVEVKAKDFAELYRRTPASKQGDLDSELAQLRQAGYVGEDDWARFLRVMVEHRDRPRE